MSAGQASFEAQTALIVDIVSNMIEMIDTIRVTLAIAVIHSVFLIEEVLCSLIAKKKHFSNKFHRMKQSDWTIV